MQTATSSALPPIARGLFFGDDTAPDTARLLGARNAATGRIVFPCPQPLPEGFEPVPLAREGVLWSFTVQRFRPKSPPYTGPEDFVPYAVGYVELAGEVIVESLLTDIAFDDLAIGMPLQLTINPVPGPGGGICATYAFGGAGQRS